MNDPKMRLPTALVLGPMKAGTTWLHSYLQERGDICLPMGVKETFFFDRNADKDVCWYARHFRHFDPRIHRSIVEVGASYFPEADAPRRIRDTLGGDVTLLVLMRDPVARAWSHYQHLRRMGYTRDPLLRAVECFPEILAASRYREGLDRWCDALPDCRLVILQFDHIRTRPDVFLRDVCSALNVEPRAVADPDRLDRNEAAEARAMWLARAGRMAATALRAGQFYGIVNLAKRVGLKRIVFGSPGAGARRRPPPEEAGWLTQRLADEVEFFASTTCGTHIPGLAASCKRHGASAATAGPVAP